MCTLHVVWYIYEQELKFLQSYTTRAYRIPYSIAMYYTPQLKAKAHNGNEAILLSGHWVQ